MDSLNIICKLCGHMFRIHHNGELEGVTWWCDGENESCPCDSFWPLQTGQDGDEIQVPYDGESYKYN